MTQATIHWTEIPHVHENTYQHLLKAYRSEYDFIVKDANDDPQRASQPFLLADEKDYPPVPLSFDLVRRAFLKEYRRRYDNYQQAGGEPYVVAAPTFLSAAERVTEY